MNRLLETEHYLKLYKEDLLFLGFSMESTTFHMKIARNYAVEFLLEEQFQPISSASRSSLLEIYVVDYCLRTRLVRSKAGLERRLDSLKRFLESLQRHRCFSMQSLSKAFSFLDVSKNRWLDYLEMTKASRPRNNA